jgi:hypothetical protein
MVLIGVMENLEGERRRDKKEEVVNKFIKVVDIEINH